MHAENICDGMAIRGDKLANEAMTIVSRAIIGKLL